MRRGSRLRSGSRLSVVGCRWGCSRLRQLLAVAALTLAAWASPPRVEKRPLSIRGVVQDLYHYDAAGTRALGKVLYLPGDGGWRGLAITIAEKVAEAGYEVYGLDTNRYLSGFTGTTTLTEEQVSADMRTIAESIRGNDALPVIFMGWSEGAGLGVLAVAPEENKRVFRGLLAIGLPKAAILGWRWADNISWIVKKMPNEPTFQTGPYLPKIAPLPLMVIQSSSDEWLSTDGAKDLFAAAREPKRLAIVEARSHRFDGNRNEFFHQLREGLAWITQNR